MAWTAQKETRVRIILVTGEWVNSTPTLGEQVSYIQCLAKKVLNTLQECLEKVIQTLVEPAKKATFLDEFVAKKAKEDRVKLTLDEIVQNTL